MKLREATNLENAAAAEYPFQWLRLLRLSKDSNWEHIIQQHKEMYQLIIRQEKEQVVQIMENHLRLVVIEQDMLKEKYPHYFI